MYQNRSPEIALSKVPEVTLVFWIIKIAATTLGETGGDSVTMTLDWGYLAGTALFLGFCSLAFQGLAFNFVWSSLAGRHRCAALPTLAFLEQPPAWIEG